MPKIRHLAFLVFPLANLCANEEKPLNDYQIDNELYRLESYSIQHGMQTVQQYNDLVESYLMDYESTVAQFYELGQAAMTLQLQSLFAFIDSRYFESADVAYNATFSRYRNDLTNFNDSQAQFFKYYNDLTNFISTAQNSADSSELTYNQAQMLNENYHEAFYSKLARVRLEQADQKYESSQTLLQSCRESQQLFERVMDLANNPLALQNLRDQWIQFKRALKHFESRHKNLTTLRRTSETVIRDYSMAYNYIAESISTSSSFRILNDTQSLQFRERLLDTRSHWGEIYPHPPLLRLSSILIATDSIAEIDDQDAHKTMQVLDWLAELEAEDIQTLRISQNQLEGIIQKIEESLQKTLPLRSDLIQQLNALRETMDTLQARTAKLPREENPPTSPLVDPEFADYAMLESLPPSLRAVLQPNQTNIADSGLAESRFTDIAGQNPVEAQLIPTLPNVVNMPAQRAADLLKAAGYKVSLANGPSTIDRRLMDRVASQFPAAGTLEVEDEVMLRVYRLELPDRIIPSVTGLNVKQAESVLKSFGFRVEKAKSGTPPTRGLADTVSRQYPQAGDELPQGSLIRIFVYSSETSQQNGDQPQTAPQSLNFLELPLTIGFFQLDLASLGNHYRNAVRGDTVRIFAPLSGWDKKRSYSIADHITYRASEDYDSMPLTLSLKWQTDDSIGELFQYSGQSGQPALSMIRVMGDNYPETVLKAVDPDARIELNFTTPSTVNRHANNAQLEQMIRTQAERILPGMRPYARRR